MATEASSIIQFILDNALVLSALLANVFGVYVFLRIRRGNDKSLASSAPPESMSDERPEFKDNVHYRLTIDSNITEYVAATFDIPPGADFELLVEDAPPTPEDSQDIVPPVDAVGVPKRYSVQPGLTVTECPVFFCTSRTPTGSELPLKAFTDKFRRTPTYGVALVSVPHERDIGEIRKPWKVPFTKMLVFPDARKHFLINKIEILESHIFSESLKAFYEDTQQADALLFVHGYNVGFEDAVFSAAQLAIDTKVDGPVLAFSWPSKDMILGYVADKDRAEASQPTLKDFLKLISSSAPGMRVNIVAHSMGNRTMLGALRDIALSVQKSGHIVNEVIMAAPDVDLPNFTEWVNNIRSANLAKRMTLYASSFDRALMGSGFISNVQRVGYAQPEAIVVNGVDTVDASRIDDALDRFVSLNHSSHRERAQLLNEITETMEGKPPKRRFWLEKPFGKDYWQFRKH